MSCGGGDSLQSTMAGSKQSTRRQVLRTSAALGVAGVGLSVTGATAANPGKGDERGAGKEFGRVSAGDCRRRRRAVREQGHQPRRSSQHARRRPVGGEEDIDNITLTVRLAAGSDAVDMNETSIKYLSGDSVVTLTNQTVTSGARLLRVTLGAVLLRPTRLLCLPAGTVEDENRRHRVRCRGPSR